MKTDEIILARNKDSTPMLKMYHSTAVTGKRVYIEHHHTQLEISAVLSGSCEWQVRRRPYLCGAGDIMLLGSDEEHYITYIGEDEPFRLLNLQVEPRFIWAPGEDSFDSRYLHIFLNHDSSFNNLLPSTNATAKRVFALLSEMYEEGMNRETGYPLIVKAELMLILGLLGREYSGFIAGAAAETGASRARIDEAMSYINDHLCDELSLDEISGHAGMSRSYFSNVFKSLNGISVWTYITGKRIELAMNYLRGSDMSITEIAGRCGFNNIANFNRSFRIVAHVTPREYRRSRLDVEEQ